MRRRWSSATTFLWAARGALTTLGPGVGLALAVLARLDGPLEQTTATSIAVASSTAVSLGGLILERTPLAARLLVTAGLWTPVALVPGALLSAPMPTFWLGVLAVGGSGLAWLSPFRGGAAPVARPSDGVPVALRSSAWVTLGIGLLTLVGELAEGPGRLATAVAAAVTAAWAITWMARWWRQEPVRVAMMGVSILFSAIAAGASWEHAQWSTAAMAAAPALAVMATPGAGRGWTYVVERPARLLVTTFLALCALGTVLLALPYAGRGIDISVMDAAFTAVSAVCVTGLIVLDTPNAFSPSGQAAILLLIQLGGLGIMSFYTAALSAAGRRLSLRHERALAAAMSIADRSQLRNAMLRVLGVTLTAEGIGAVLLTWRFLAAGDGWGQAIWRGTFTAVSAFCNAGFALQTDSLVPYQHDLLALHVVGALIVIGGLSPVVVVSLPRLARRRPVPMQVRLIVVASLVLLIGGFLGYLAFEWSASLRGMSVWDRIHNAWFQSVTRTAGFTSVDFLETTAATQTLMIALMFIGGSPGGTAGGVKTTTATVLVLAVLAALRHKPDAVAFSRRLTHVTVYRAAAVFTLGILSVVAALIALQLTQDIPLDVVAFETFSALGTVGLSLGGTGELDSVGKVIVMLCMFSGRVGPLTLFLFLVERSPARLVTHPPEELDVG